MRLLLAVVASLLAAAPLTAQDLGEACRSLTEVTVGQWAEYQVSSGQEGARPMSMYSAIVGSEEVEGEEHFWHESKVDSPQGTVIVQMLVPDYPFSTSDIKRSIIKMGPQPAMEMPEQMRAMMQEQSEGEDDPIKDVAEACNELTALGRESVTVPAGTFDALHVRRESDGEVADVWIDTDIPFGLVKATFSQEAELLLTGHGDDATSSITETPRRMPGGGGR